LPKIKTISQNKTLTILILDSIFKICASDGIFFLRGTRNSSYRTSFPTLNENKTIFEICASVKSKQTIPFLAPSFVQGRDGFSIVKPSAALNPYFQFFVAGNEVTSGSEIFLNNAWTTSGVPSLPNNIFLTCITYRDENTLMLIAGRDVGVGPSRKTYYLSFPSPQWVPGPLVIEGRVGPGCERILTTKGSTLESIIAVGGMTSTDYPMSSVELLDDGSNTWR